MGSLHPKVKWQAIVAVIVSAIIGLLDATGHPLDPGLSAILVTVIGGIIGYVIPSPAGPHANAPRSGAPLQP
jgi:hypothetical protein